MRAFTRTAATLLALTLWLAGAAAAQAPERLWYATSGEASVESFLAHANQIDVIAPQVYSMDSTGVIWGAVDARMLAAAREHGVKVVPLVVNSGPSGGFDQETMHRVLTVPEARQRAISRLAALCRENHYAGLQLDFENIRLSDRDAFSSFAAEAADSMHRAGCTLSAAVVPRSGEFPGPTSYHQWMYENWRGVYDYRALARSLDYISLMTYAEHTGGTPPGPIAGYPWMEAAVRYVLDLGVPPEKVSLGLASYSGYWFPTHDENRGAHMEHRGLSYTAAMGILARNGVQPVWDERQKTNYAFWQNDGINEFIFLEDTRSFLAKEKLVPKYHLRGYSVWVLGNEDPGLWPRISSGR